MEFEESSNRSGKSLAVHVVRVGTPDVVTVDSGGGLHDNQSESTVLVSSNRIAGIIVKEAKVLCYWLMCECVCVVQLILNFVIGMDFGWSTY